MTEITIKYGIGVISGLDFRNDIVKKGSDLLSGGHMGEIKEACKYFAKLMFWEHLFIKYKVLCGPFNCMLRVEFMNCEVEPGGGWRKVEPEGGRREVELGEGGRGAAAAGHVCVQSAGHVLLCSVSPCRT